MTLEQIISKSRSDCLKIHRLDNPSGLQVLKFETPKASLVLHLQGAHVTSFVPRGAGDLLWLSSMADFTPGKAIRGGIPICWPWFGKHNKPDLPQHGFARNSLFQLLDVQTNKDDDAIITLALNSSDETMTVFPYAFNFKVELTLSTSLTIKLKTTNLSETPFPLSQAIHTYFNISNIHQVALSGLTGRTFIDQLSSNTSNETRDTTTFAEETDRIYQTENAKLVINDSTRKIIIEQQGDNSAVVWNPWIDKSQRLSDFPDEGYLEMLCVEAANTGDKLLLQPGDSYELSQTIGLEA